MAQMKQNSEEAIQKDVIRQGRRTREQERGYKWSQEDEQEWINKAARAILAEGKKALDLD